MGEDAGEAKAGGPSGTPPIGQGDLEFVRQEYFFMQSSIEDYQKQSLDIKKLSLGLSAGVAFLQSAVKVN